MDASILNGGQWKWKDCSIFLNSVGPVVENVVMSLLSKEINYVGALLRNKVDIP